MTRANRKYPSIDQPPTRHDGPRVQELVDSLLIWARPDAPFVVAGAEVTHGGASWRCCWHPIIGPVMGHPIDVLRWAAIPASWAALGVAAWGTAQPLESGRTAAEAVRVTFVLTRSGGSLGKVCYPDGAQYVTSRPVGRMVDACAAALASSGHR